ncbi:MAG: DUF58 domain-containing protein [Aquabacterium sp.]
MSAAAAAGWPGQERRGLRRRWNNWFEARLPRADSWALTQRNIYIVPTKAGLAFALTVALMLVASINYQLNLGYALTFLLAGAALVSMHQTHAVLRGLTLHVKTPQPVFAGDPATIEVTLSNPGRARHGVGLAVRWGRPYRMAWVDVPAHGSETARLSFVPEGRGQHELPTLLAETRFPLGLFRAWTLWRPACRVLAYPRPESPAQPLPAPGATTGGLPQSTRSDGGEFDGVRAYRRGDSLRRVVWKKAARTGELVSRETSASLSREMWLEWQATGVADGETRLQRIAAWVLAAERQGLVYGLRLPGLELAASGGDAQRRLALTALALWNAPAPGAREVR